MPQKRKKGTLYGVGVGPGDCELITLKGYRAIQAAPIIAYPATQDGLSMAHDIAAPHMTKNHRKIPILIPITKPPFPDRDLYDIACKALMEELRKGDDIALLCEGDPFFYGSFSYVFLRISQHYPTEIIPGISSPLASASCLKRPLALRDDRLTIIPATLPEEKIIPLLDHTEIAVFIKLGRHSPKIYRLLEKKGLLEHASYIEYATMARQKIHRLCDIDPKNTPYFSMIILEIEGALWKETTLLPS